MTRNSTKVTTKEGEDYTVYFKYKVTPQTYWHPQEFYFEVTHIYDEDGWEVTDTIDEETFIEIENLAIEKYDE